MPITEAAERLAPTFVKHGYAFFYPFRRGYGASRDAGPFLQDRLALEEKERGNEARQRLQDTLLETEQLDDVLAALAWLRSRPEIAPGRVALAGHSFGGQLTLVAAGRDTSVRAAVTFAAAAGSWARSEELRRVLTESVRRARCPMMLLQWRNDFSIEATTALATERNHAGHSPITVLYPPLGSTPEEGHDGLYLDMGRWQPDVFRFLEQALSP